MSREFRLIRMVPLSAAIRNSRVSFKNLRRASFAKPCVRAKIPAITAASSHVSFGGEITLCNGIRSRVSRMG